MESVDDKPGQSSETDDDADEAEFARLQRYDTKIEADFQQAVAAIKEAGNAKRGLRYMGAPRAFWLDVYHSVTGHSGVALLVAALIYRRTKVCNARTVKLSGTELADFGIDRAQKLRALLKLQEAGLVRIDREGPGRSTKVTLLWGAGWTGPGGERRSN
jgi:hypothetical protein